MFTRMTGGNSGGMPRFTITKAWRYDQSGYTYTKTVPSDTDFLMIMQCTIAPTSGYANAVTVNPVPTDIINYIFNKGDSVTVTQWLGISGSSTVSPSSITSTVTWNNNDTITQTRSSTGGSITVLACKYVEE